MTARTTETEIAALREFLVRANQAYYERDAPEISDAEYDKAFRRLQQLELEHPQLATPDSPTRRVGGAPASALPKHTHLRPMLSLANAFDDDEFAGWEDRNARLVPEVRTAGYTLEIKIDGTAISLTYHGGKLVTGATRGNGAIGEDVTANLRTIDDVPLELAGDGWPEIMEVRGEVYFAREAFRKLNARRADAGEPLFANPRNAAAGALRQLDPAITRSRRLRCFAFHVEAIVGNYAPRSHHAMLDDLRRWGFVVEPNVQRVEGLGAATTAVAEMHALLDTLPFAADGIVVKVDRRDLQDELGVVGGREPRWAIARKFAPDVAVTRLARIGINVGRTGALAPYAQLEPVELAGVTISLATLHNEDLIAQKDLREGDWVEVIRAGEVIPQILGSLPDRRDGSQVEWTPPSSCPVCGTPSVREADEAMRYCPNPLCPGRQFEGIVHFASRDAMDIRGLGAERVRQLLDASLIEDAADIYQLTVDELLTLERFARPSASKLIDAIDASKRQPLSLLLFGLGIRHVGKTVAQLLARHFGSLDALQAAEHAVVAEVSGAGPVIAAAVHEYMRDPRSADLLDRLRRAGMNTIEPDAPGSTGVLSGMTFVLTGTLPTLSRTEASTLIERAGGKIGSGVSKRTSAVVAGEEAGGKLDRARELGVEVIDEAELLRRINPGS